jgi:phosphotriesterase-related protein
MAGGDGGVVVPAAMVGHGEALEPAALAGKVVTVLGPIDPAELGLCLPHEHVLCALDQGLEWPATATAGATCDAALFAAAPITLANLERVHRQPYGNRANLRLDDRAEMVAELRLFAAAGGRAVVDQTLDEFGRDRAGLAWVAHASGLHVVAGCGHYVADLQARAVAHLTVDGLAAELMADLLADPRRSGLPCGLIGEIGVSSGGIAATELRMLQAVARAQRRSGAPVSIHSLAPGHSGLEALLVLREHGVDPSRVAVCHLDSGIDLDYCRALAHEGAFLEFDWFGWSAPGESQDGAELPHSDRERIAAVAQLCGEGLADRLLLSHDIAMKIQLAAYGGLGYAHLARNLPPFFAARGVDAATLRAIMVDNPARWLTWQAPAEP